LKINAKNLPYILYNLLCILFHYNSIKNLKIGRE
jgi:hypothetical protein